MSTIAQLPVDFSLVNQANDAAALFTLGQPVNGQSLEMKIWNRATATLRIPQSTGTPAADDFHFSLLLPPGLLAQSGFGLRVPDGWQASVASVDADGFTRVYVLRTGEALNIPTEEDSNPLQFQLEGIYLDSELAWHHTSIVLQSQGVMVAEQILPTSFRRIPIRILHTFATDLSELDSAQSVPALRDAMIQLRDITVPPLQVQIVEDLNFLTDVNLQTVQLEISANPVFFSAASTATVGVNSTDTTITIAALTQTAGEDISAELQGGEDDWSLQNDGDVIILTPRSALTVIDEFHLIELSVTLRVEPLQYRDLLIECDGFKKVGHSEPFEKFTLSVPLYIGTLRVRNESFGAPLTAFGPISDDGVKSIFTVGEMDQLDEDAAGIRFGLRVPEGGDYSRAWIQSYGQALELSAGEDPIIALRPDGEGGNFGIGLLPWERWKLHINGDVVIREDLIIEPNEPTAMVVGWLDNGPDPKIMTAGEAMFGAGLDMSQSPPYSIQYMGVKGSAPEEAFLQAPSPVSGDGPPPRKPVVLQVRGGLHFQVGDHTPLVVHPDGGVKMGVNTTTPAKSMLGLEVELAENSRTSLINFTTGNPNEPSLKLEFGAMLPDNNLNLPAGTFYSALDSNRSLVINHETSQLVHFHATADTPVVIGVPRAMPLEAENGTGEELNIRLFMEKGGASNVLRTEKVTINNTEINIQDDVDDPVNQVRISTNLGSSILIQSEDDRGWISERGIELLHRLMDPEGMEVKIINESDIDEDLTMRQGEGDPLFGSPSSNDLIFIEEVPWMHEKWSDQNTFRLVMEPLPPEED